MTDIRIHELPGGARLATERNHSAASAAVSIRLPLGSARDPEGMVGAAPILEELLLRGSADKTSREQADAFDAIGVSRSTTTGTFHLSVGATALGTRLDDAFPLLVEMVRTPRLDDDGFRAARDLCVQSVRGLADDPAERAMIALGERHGPSPINRSHLGTEEGLRAASADRIREHFASGSVPGGTLIAAAGSLDHDRVADRFALLLDGWQGSAPDLSWDGTNAIRGYGHTEHESNQTHIAVAHDAPPEADRDSVYERLAAAVLSGGMSGRLFTEVREKRGLCYAVHASYSTARTFGRCTAYVGTTPDKAQESLDVLLGELTRLGTPDGPVTPDEFARAKTGLKSRLVMSGESTRARASALATDLDRLGRARPLHEIAREIDAATLDGLAAYLTRRDRGRLTIVSVGPAPLKVAGSVGSV